MKINGNLMTLLAIHKNFSCMIFINPHSAIIIQSPLKVCNLNSKIQSDHIGVFFFSDPHHHSRGCT